MDVINEAARGINNAIAYLRDNAWPIAFMLALWFFLKPKVLSAVDDMKTRRSPQQVKDYDNDMQRVRRMQQLQAQQDAKIKAQELKETKATEVLPEKKEKKKTKPASTTTKPKSVSTSTSNLSMNNFSNTPSYRPQRRTVRRG